MVAMKICFKIEYNLTAYWLERQLLYNFNIHNSQETT